MHEAKFCFTCGKQLAMRYPGCGPGTTDHGVGEQGNPEDGPRSLRCPDGHETLEENLLSYRWNIFTEVLEEILQPSPFPEDQLSDDVEMAAQILLEQYSNEEEDFDELA